MGDNKNIEQIIDKVCAFIQEVPITEQNWLNRRERLLEDLKKLIQFLIDRDIIGVRPPWCVGGVIKYPPPFDDLAGK